MNNLLIISELGTLTHLQDRFIKPDWEVQAVNSQRKALKLYKYSKADIILAEFIFTPDFRDRISNLDTMCSQIQSLNPQTRLMVVYESEDEHALQRLNTMHPIHTAWKHPIQSDVIYAQIMTL